MMKPVHISLAILIAMALFTPTAIASQSEPVANPEAMKAFVDLVASYRQRPALTVKSTIKVELSEGEASAAGKEVVGEFIFGPKRKAVIKLNDFTCYLTPAAEGDDSGVITVVHNKNASTYFSGSDDGSPYYALFHALKDMPFPELAIMLGEDDPNDVLLQFHPKALNGVVPTAIKNEEKDGVKLQRMTLTGEHETIDMWIAPDSKLIQSIDVKIVGGNIAAADVAVVYKHSYDYTIHEKPLSDETFVFEPGERQKVDVVLALLPKPAPHGGGGGEDDDGGGGDAHQLVGNPAPEFILSTSDGKAVDLNDLRGKVVVIDFWASWCGPCLAALPKLHEVAKWANTEQLPVAFYTMNVFELRQNDTPDGRLKSAKNTWEKRQFSLPILMDYTDETAAAYGVRGIPALFIIRADGVVHTAHVGMSEDYVEALKRDIHAAIKAVEQ